MANPRIDQLDAHTPLDGDDLLHLYQDDGVDRKASLDDHFAWLKEQPTFAPSLNLGTFYVDAENGSDSADGRALATAKKTINAILSGSLPVGAQCKLLLKDGQTHTLTDNIPLTTAYIEINSTYPNSPTPPVLTSEFATGTYINAFYLYNSSLFLNNLTIQTLDGTGKDVSQYSAMIFTISGGSGMVNFDPASIAIVDTPLIFMSANGAGLNIGLSTVDITVTPGGAATPDPVFIGGNSCFTLNGQAVTLGQGLTWPDLVSDTHYGADHSPNNFTHNLLTAFDQ